MKVVVERGRGERFSNTERHRERHSRARTRERKRSYAVGKSLSVSGLCYQLGCWFPQVQRPPQTVGRPLPVSALTSVPGPAMSKGRDLEFVNFLFLLYHLLKK